jgi:hypothetical protein
MVCFRIVKKGSSMMHTVRDDSRVISDDLDEDDLVDDDLI